MFHDATLEFHNAILNNVEWQETKIKCDLNIESESPILAEI